MADLKLDILVVPTYNLDLLNVTDASIYPDPLTVTSPAIEITVPGFNRVLLPFTIQQPNVFNSVSLGLSEPGEYLSLPDGIYNIKYSIAPAQDNFITRNIFRTEKLQEKFDNAFMQLDMMECDRAIKEQSQVKLNTINIFFSTFSFTKSFVCKRLCDSYSFIVATSNIQDHPVVILYILILCDNYRYEINQNSCLYSKLIFQ